MSDKKDYLPPEDIENILSILNKISIFGGLSQKQLHSVFKVLEKFTYEKDEIIFSQGESSSYIYIIECGRIKLYIKDDTATLELIEFNVGRCFGETSLIGIQPHTASAVAVEKTELIAFSSKALLSLYNSNKDIYLMIILNIARETCRRLNKADNILLHYYHISAASEKNRKYEKYPRSF